MGIICFNLVAIMMIYFGWNALKYQRLPVELNLPPDSIQNAGKLFLTGGSLIVLSSMGFVLHIKALGMLFVIGFVVLMVGFLMIAVAYQRQYL